MLSIFEPTIFTVTSRKTMGPYYNAWHNIMQGHDKYIREAQRRGTRRRKI